MGTVADYGGKEMSYHLRPQDHPTESTSLGLATLCLESLSNADILPEANGDCKVAASFA